MGRHWVEDRLDDAPASLLEALDKCVFGGAWATPFGRRDALSGYDYRLPEGGRAEVGFAPLSEGGFAVHYVVETRAGRREIWDLFGEDGAFLSRGPAIDRRLLPLSEAVMDPGCPIVSHLYQYLAYQYEQAGIGLARPAAMRVAEVFLRGQLVSRPGKLSVSDGPRDAALERVHAAILRDELDPVLSWEERQRRFADLRAERDRTVRTKRRVHALGWARYSLPIHWGDFHRFCQRLSLRPGSNLRGISYRYTFGVLGWFFRTVRANLGYSVALAIYGPFTFYFITQPLNPHAMWAVGRVRSVYLETVDQLRGRIGLQGTAIADTGDAPGAPGSPHRDAWRDRMSAFKGMQIGYEENLVFAARMGRLEHMETQLAFPLVAEAAWLELGRYVAEMPAAADPALAPYLAREKQRARELQIYVWDRLFRYLLDHPYIVMDRSREQVARDYYADRTFILFRDMTFELSRRDAAFRKPPELADIEAWARRAEQRRQGKGGILDRLRESSSLFRQGDRFDGQELRAVLQRQWEKLYLLQSKAQEAANFGLMTYTWSVRNALWIVQALYSAKRRELRLLAGGDRMAWEREAHESLEPQQESLFHLLNLEFVSIRPELAGRMSGDPEVKQRQRVIALFEQSLKDREELIREKYGKQKL